MIPEELRKLDQWVCVFKDSKIPMKSYEYEGASSTNPDTWSDFETAEKSVSDGYYNNVGFVFNDNGYVGIDIDTGYDEYGLISEVAADIISECKSYTERSRSGRGFHVIVKGDIPFNGSNNLKGVEIYKAGRYFIMTGNSFLFTEIKENQEAIDYVLAKYFNAPADESEHSDNNKSNNTRIFNPVYTIKSEGRIPVRADYKEITIGGRNMMLTSIAGLMHSTGYKAENILHELDYFNKHYCKPPIPKMEVKRIVQSITRYKR